MKITQKGMSVKIILLLITLGQLANSAKVSKDNVVMMVEMIRHGARAPIKFIKREKWIDAIGTGELSDTGKRMEYYLGLNTKYRYPNFFSKPLKYNEYWLRSTPFNRTLMSGMSHTLGMIQKFVPNETLQFSNDDIRLLPPQMKNGALFNISDIKFRTPLPYGFQPFPLYTDFPKDEYLLMKYCKGVNKARVESYAEISAKLDKSKFFGDLYQWTLGKYGLSDKKFDPKTSDGNSSFIKMIYLSDFAIMDYLNNPNPTIKNTDPKYGYLQDVQSLQIFQRYGQTESMKSIVTPPLTQIRTYFQNKIISASSGSYPLRYALFSAHDSMISPHMLGMNPPIVNISCLMISLTTGKRNPNCTGYPAVGSNIIWELIQNGTEYFVKVSYNAVYLDYCNTGKKDGNGEFYCTMDEFDKTIDGKINPDYKSYCGYETSGASGEDKMAWVYYGIIAGLLVYSIIMTFICVRNGVEKKTGESFDDDVYQRSVEESSKVNSHQESRL